MLLKINSQHTEAKKIRKVADCLQEGGVIIYPTDTVYTFGCDAHNKEAIEKVKKIKNLTNDKHHFSLICHDLSQVAQYAKHFDSATHKYMNSQLPGPYTFILNAKKEVSKLFGFNKKTIGVRVPDNNIAQNIVENFERPIISASLHNDDEVLTYMTDPDQIHEKFEKSVDIVIDGGPGDFKGSTVVDFSGEEPQLVREGKGALS